MLGRKKAFESGAGRYSKANNFSFNGVMFNAALILFSS